MKERNLKIKELLQVMLDNQDLFTISLCYWATNLRRHNKISHSEYELLNDYIVNNPPFLYKINIFKTDPFYWEKYCITPRILWLKKHIAKL
jgi:hypothetical protein